MGAIDRRLKAHEGYVVVASGERLLRQFLVLLTEMHCAGGIYYPKAGLNPSFFMSRRPIVFP